MEDSKRIYRFFRKPGEDYHLWCARTEAALAAKEVMQVVETDVLTTDVPLTAEITKQVATARAVIIQGLGDRPLRLCLNFRNNPYKMWTRLRDRYAVSNTATRVQLHTKMSRMSYK